MSETKNLKLFKHNEPLETNENQFDIKKSLHDNWDKLDEFAGKVNTKTVEIENKQKQHDTDISNIKQEQQDQNSKIENNTTENKDNTEILNQIMGLLPSTKGEGEHVTLQDTGEARFKNFEIKGNSKQATRTGKNLFNKSGELINYQTELAQTNSGIKVTSTVATSGGWTVVKNDLSHLLGKTITIYTEIIANPNNQGLFAIYFGNELNPTKEWIKSSKYLNNGEKYKFTIAIPNAFPNECNNIYISFYSNGNPHGIGNIGDYVEYSKLMLVEGTEVPAEYEQYGASPSPEFPSKIRNVGDNINLYSKDNANILNTMIDKQGLGVNAGDTYKTIYIPCKPNTTYTVSKLYDATKNRFALGFTDTEPTYSMKVEGYITNANVSDLTITTGANAKYLLAYIWITGGTTTYKEMLDSIKIEEGVHATAYSPYNCGNAEITVGNKNLANTKIIKNTNIITVNEDGSITLANNSNTAGYASTGKKLNELCKGLKVGDTAYLKLITTSTNNIYLQGKANQYWLGNNSNKITKDMLEDTVIVYGGYNKTDKLQIQITKNTIGDYAQNKQQTIVFPFTEGQRLHKGDYLAEDGIHHARKQIVLDGTEAWGQYNRGTTDFFGVALKVSDIKSGQTIMCNKLIEDGSKIYSTNGEAVGCLTDNYLYICIKRVRIGATINTTFEECLELFKQYLTNCYNKGESFIIEYGLINEENEPYTPEQQEAHKQLKKLHSYNEQTNIFSKDEISPIFKVEAIKNLNATFAQLSATMLERS